MELVIDRLTKQFQNKIAVDRVSLRLHSGVFGLLGTNGAGKTTLMRMLCGILQPTSGTITFDGMDVREEGYRAILGYLPQDFGYYPEFTAMDFLLYMAALKGLPKKSAKRRANELLELVGLQDMGRKKIKTFSGGMKQRLGIAQALLNNPKLLILDEPTAGLDPKQRIAIRNYISKIAFNKIVLIATHVVPDIEFIAKDIIMLKKGVIVDNAPPHELVKKIDGGVWLVPCAESEVQAMQDKFRVTNIARDEQTGEVLLRMLADEQPTDKSRTVSPTLEDYYLHVFGDASGT